MSPNDSPAATPAEPTLLFRSGRDATIRVLCLGSLAFAGLMGWLLTLSPGPEAPPESVGERLFVVALALVAGLGTPLGLVAYGRRYVSLLALDRDGQAVHVTLVGFFRTHTRRIALADLGAPRSHEGRLDLPRAPSVNAPWLTIPVRSGPNLIIDQQGEVLDERAWQGLLKRLGLD